MNAWPPPDADTDRAAECLRRHGFPELDRHWVKPGVGAADLMASRRRVLVIGKIRFAPHSRSFGRAEISEKQIRRLRGVAGAWAQAHGTRYEQIRVWVITLSQTSADGQEVG